MPPNGSLISLTLKLLFLTFLSHTQFTIFGWNDILFIQVCPLGVRAPGMQTIICSSVAQYNVTKAALALSEHRKESNQIIKFSVSPIILSGNPMIVFGAQLNITSPSVVGIRLGFFVAILKGHRWWRMIDMVFLQWNPGSTVDTQDSFPRTNTLTFPISSSTIFQNSTTNMQVHAFTSSFHMQPQRDSSLVYNQTRPLEFRLSASLNPTTNCIEASLTAQAFVKIQKFSGFILVVNVSEYNLANLHGWRYGYKPYQFTSTPGFLLDLRTVQPQYGPSFSGKCMFGIDKLIYRGDDAFNYEFGYTPVYNSIVILKETTGAAVTYAGNTFCVGRYIVCYEHLGSHVDEYTLQCYTPATCPLPIFPVWTSRTICPRCADYACFRCDIPTRKICTGCYGHLFTVLNTTTKQCQCMINYMPIKYPTKPGQGLWGNQNQTLWMCKVNCSAAIKNCIFGACTNQTFCNSCDYMYTLNPISPGVRRCVRCATILSNCVACSTTTVCDLCTKNHYLVDYFDSTGALIVTQCRPCRQKIEYCVECTQTGVCLQCAHPYDLGATGKCDQCLPIYQNYSNTCMMYHGCMATKINEYGIEVCIACLPGIHYVYDVSTLSCVCERGYHETPNPQYWYVCEPKCGDGVVTFLTEQCDDKNNKNGDGCSQFCKVQDGYSCLPYEPSKCVFIINFQHFEYKYAFRLPGQNKARLYFKILPHDMRLQTLDWKSLIRFSFTQSAVRHIDLNLTYSYEADEIQVLVPYFEQLENLLTETKLTLIPEHVVSNPSEFAQRYQLNGVNAPLIFESALILKTEKMVDLLSLVFAIVALLQFYIGSYFGKMIGLQTLQIIQTIYFTRMAIVTQNSAFVNSLNNLKYTTVGYFNPKLFYPDLKFAKNDIYTSQRGELQSIGMHKLFLLNIDLFLVTILTVVVVYCRYFRRKVKIRSDYISTKSQEIKDRYTSFKRKAEWVYSHVFFPTVMMFNYVLFFTTISSEQPTTAKQLVPLKTVETISFPFYSAVFYLTIAVWTFEIFNSYDAYIKSRMTEQQKSMTPPSLIQKLQHDENSPDRPNFDKFYILVYLVFYLVLQLAMVLSIFVKEFHFTLELILILSILYFGLIWKWSPYNETINEHNKFLRLNHGTVVFFLLSFTIMKWAKNMHQKIQVALMYTSVGLMGLVMLGGFVRIYYEHRYRVLGLKDAALAEKKQNELKKILQSLGLTKKGQLLANNKYLFQRQLQEIGRKYGIEYRLKAQELGRAHIQSQNERHKETLIKKIREELKDPYKDSKSNKKGHRFETGMREANMVEEEPSLGEVKIRLRREYERSLLATKLPWV